MHYLKTTLSFFNFQLIESLREQMAKLYILPHHFSLQIYCILKQAHKSFGLMRIKLMLANVVYDLEKVLNV